MSEIKMYITPWCPYCRAAVSLFEGKGREFEIVDVTGDRDKRRWLMEVTGQHTVPQIFIDGKSYGGFTDVQALDRQGQLDPLLGLA